VEVVSQHTSQQTKPRATTMHDTTDTAIAMVMLWAIPVLAFLFALTRL
jgi:hypothetical protein